MLLCPGCIRMSCWLQTTQMLPRLCTHRLTNLSMVKNRRIMAVKRFEWEVCHAQVPIVAALVEEEAADHDWQQPAQPMGSAPPQQLMSDVPLVSAEQVRGLGMTVAAGQ